MKKVYLGTDSGATTSKTCGVYEDGTPVCENLAQSSTNSELGTEAVVSGWIEGLEKFLEENDLVWEQVEGVGLAIPGPYKDDGVMDNPVNLPDSFSGWEFHKEYQDAIAVAAGRPIPLSWGNDGNFAGVGEAQRVRGDKKASVLMLAPGSGLGGAYIDKKGMPLLGDNWMGMEAGHVPIPYHLLGLPLFECGCGRDWGCAEPYTSISGLPQYLDFLAPKYPDHPCIDLSKPAKDRALSLRGLAQDGDALALEIFDYQAKAMGLHVASLTVAMDAEYVVIGGGLIDPTSTTEEFRARYMGGIREWANKYMFPLQQKRVKIVEATLGELSQAIGAALVALYSANK